MQSKIRTLNECRKKDKLITVIGISTIESFFIRMCGWCVVIKVLGLFEGSGSCQSSAQKVFKTEVAQASSTSAGGIPHARLAGPCFCKLLQVPVNLKSWRPSNSSEHLFQKTVKRKAKSLKLVHEHPDANNPLLRWQIY